MDLFGIKQVEKRILEIKQILGDEGRRKDMARGVAMPTFEGRLKNANRPLSAELEELETKRKFAHDNRNLFVNVLTIAVALFVAFFVPSWEISLQEKHREKADIQSLYQSIIANEDIFISNFNTIKYAQNNGLPVSTPEFHIEFPVTEGVHKKLQRGLGIDQYRFLLYFLNQTELLNQQIKVVRGAMAESSPLSAHDMRVRSFYTTMESLENGDWETAKFNYIHDTSCILYMFQKTFPSIEINERESTISCSTESLNRLFYHFGFIRAEIPDWLVPELKAALNERESGLGDRLIQ